MSQTVISIAHLRKKKKEEGNRAPKNNDTGARKQNVDISDSSHRGKGGVEKRSHSRGGAVLGG